MTLWKLTLSYDGTSFHGWQVQPGRPTIQGTLAAAIERIAGERVLPQGSGRTDAGVHALAQVASLALDSPIPPANLLRALNRALPPSIRVLEAEIAAPNFHARHSALRKTYEYRIFERRPQIPAADSTRALDVAFLRYRSPEPPGNTTPDRICPPFLAPFVWDCRWPLRLDLMQHAAALLCGTHDFTSFAASDPDLTLRDAGTPPSQPDSAPPTVSQNLSSNTASPTVPQNLSSDSASPAVPQNLSSDSASPAVPQNLSSRPEQRSFIALRSGETCSSLAANPQPSAPNPTKTVFTSTIQRANDLLLYRITGSGFLHHMVRNIVGTLVEIGRGSLAAETVPGILAARNRAAAGPTAPASGLFLVNVEYDKREVNP